MQKTFWIFGPVHAKTLRSNDDGCKKILRRHFEKKEKTLHQKRVLKSNLKILYLYIINLNATIQTKFMKRKSVSRTQACLNTARRFDGKGTVLRTGLNSPISPLTSVLEKTKKKNSKRSLL